MTLAIGFTDGYQLTIAPKSFYEIRGKQAIETCILCNEELVQLDRFDDVINEVRTNFYYTGDFKMCPECGHAHYIIDKTDNITGPVTLQWKN
jgi:hypothetical protein